MFDILKWYLFIQLLGLINLPITLIVFRKLPSKGLYFSKPLGLLLWGFVFWWLASIGLLRNDLASAITALLLVLAANLFIIKKQGFSAISRDLCCLKKLIIASEVVFLFGFLFWALVRAANPDIIHTEKFMEMAFINAILKSPTFPPHDPWLSGYSISYYYFGYVLSAMLIRVTGVSSSVGYNLISALWFALTALGAYGLLWDFLIGRRANQPLSEQGNSRLYWLALLAPLMMLIVSNWYGVLDVLHARGFASPQDLQGLNLPALSSDPYNYSWFPNRGGWSWWQGSRVLQDFRLNGSAIEIIDEFPFFTFLLADIHPHLLGMPFVLLAIGQAYNAYLGGWEQKKRLFGKQIPVNPGIALIAVITLGGLAFLNTWDFPFYLLLIAVALVWFWAQQEGWNDKRIKQLFVVIIVGGFASILAYLPFYLSFASQAGGILPSLAFFTRGINFWIMFGPLLLAILIWLTYRQVRAKRFPGWKALLLSLALFTLLFILSWGLGCLAGRLENMDQLLNGLQGSQTNGQLLVGAIVARLKAPGTFLTLLILVWMGIDQILNQLSNPKPNSEPESSGGFTESFASSKTFILMLILLGALLVIVPEFIYLRDQFSTRMNTIFKFYFQAWILWSLAGSFAIADFFSNTNPKADRVFALTLLIPGLIALAVSIQQKELNLGVSFGASWLDYLIVAIPVLFLLWFVYLLTKKKSKAALGVLCLIGLAGGMVYPVIELWNKTEGFAPQDGFSLDGKQDFYVYSPDEMTAAAWLEQAPLGIMAEAVADTGGSYTTYNLISTFSGMPTVLGWIGHESQWRGGYEEIGSRQNDLVELYSTANWQRAKDVIDRYNIRYIVVGELERQTYAVEVTKFENNLQKVLDTNSVDIYEVSQP